MVRRLAWALIVVMTAAVFGIPASAAEQTGTIRISMDYGRGMADGGEVALYFVAEPMETGYRLGEAYGGGIIRREDACSPELALWLADRENSARIFQKLDPQGTAEFTDLEEGLYLAIQTTAPQGWYCAAPFLVPLPLDGQWEVLAYPKNSVLLTESPKTGQRPAPLFAAMGLVLSGTGLYFCMEKLRKK